MAKKDSTKTKAELYREERKERIAKANKKNARSIEAGKAVAGIGKKIIAVILCLAILCGIGLFVNSTTGFVQKAATALKVGGQKVSASDFRYYYSTMYQNTSSMASQYTQYGMDMGFNSELSPDDPSNTTTDEEGNTITWAESIKKSAIERAQFITAYYKEAQKAGFKLSDDKKAELQETIDSYNDSASESNYSLGAFLKANFGPGFSERKFRNQIEMEQTASEFYTSKQDEFDDGISLDEIKKEYNKSTKDYDYVDIHYYKFSRETLTKKDSEKETDLQKRQDKANEELYAKVQSVFDKSSDLKSLEAAISEYLAAEAEAEKATASDAAETAAPASADEETENTTEIKNGLYSNLKSSLNEKAADWVYAKERKAGDKTVIKDGVNAFIIIVDKAAYTGHSIDVRHCLVKFNAEDEENVTDEEKAKAKKTAEDLLAEWEKGEKTDASFAEFAKNHSEDEGSKEDGGLLAGTRITDSLVKEFLDWCFEPGRKEGDYGIIESTYGYHIMYFSKDNKDDLDQYNTIRETKGHAEFDAYNEKLLAEDGDYKIEENKFWTQKVTDQFCKRIKKNIAYSNNRK